MNTSKLCLRAENLSKEYKSEKGHVVYALDKITIDIYENDFVCIVGPSGCGNLLFTYYCWIGNCYHWKGFLQWQRVEGNI